jgi:hypothetical protein
MVVTEWEEFREVDWKRLASVMEQPLIIDGRNMFSPGEVSGHGFRYISIGRTPAMPLRLANGAVANSSLSPQPNQPQEQSADAPRSVKQF